MLSWRVSLLVIEFSGLLYHWMFFFREDLQTLPKAPPHYSSNGDFSFIWDLLNGFYQTTSCRSKRRKYVLIAAEHLTGWMITRSKEHETLDVAWNFAQDKIKFTSEPSKVIISDNAGWFTEKAL